MHNDAMKILKQQYINELNIELAVDHISDGRDCTRWMLCVGRVQLSIGEAKFCHPSIVGFRPCDFAFHRTAKDDDQKRDRHGDACTVHTELTFSEGEAHVGTNLQSC